MDDGSVKVANDFDFSRREIEQNEELDVVVWAENNGWVVRKLQYIGRRGCPDRGFFGYGQILLIEMKRPDRRNKKGGGLSSGQSEEFKRLAAVGVQVRVFYTGAEAIAFLKTWMPLL